MALVSAAVTGALLWGFVSFSSLVAGYAPVVTEAADGIVVLTGGELRVAEGVRLLQQGKAKRLLVSGVHAETSKEMLRRSHHIRQFSQFECCVDLGYAASDTIGNAEEARAWARRNGFKSLIVVTSNYHLPRSLAELAHAMPDVRLLPYPVVHRLMRVEAWWAYPQTAQVLVWEYLKYVRTSARLQASRLVDKALRTAAVDAPPPLTLAPE